MSESKLNIKVLVLCDNANGEPEFFTFNGEFTQEQYDNGDHYDIAKEHAENEGYEPKAAFDEKDYAYKQIMNGLGKEESNTVEVVLNTFDDGGNVVDTTTMPLSHEAISDIIDHAAQAMIVNDSGTEVEFDVAFDELRSALETYGVIDSDKSPTP